MFMFAWIWRNLWPFSWPGSRVQEDAEVDEPEHPLLLIPGICGTQLAIKDKGADHEDLATRVWVCIAHAVRSSTLADVDGPQIMSWALQWLLMDSVGLTCKCL